MSRNTAGRGIRPSGSNSMEYTLKKETELRFEVEQGESVSVTVLSGYAELFGTELLPQCDYVFPELSKVAVFTWHGCRLSLTGKTEAAYSASTTPMTIYMNLHGALEQLRDDAVTEKGRGPSVMVVGPANTGRTSLCHLLLNYAVRLKRKPLYVDLDVSQSEIGIPGTIGAVLVERSANPVTGFNTDNPLLYHFGHLQPGANVELFNEMVVKLAEVLNVKCDAESSVDTSGVIINTCSWVREDGVTSIINAAQAFEVAVILVLDSERLLAELRNAMPSFVKIVLIPKSGGVVDRSKEQRLKERYNKIHEYFYGEKNKFYPFSFELSTSDVKLLKLGAPSLPSSLLPLGMRQEENKTKLMSVGMSRSLVNHVLSVSSAPTEDMVRDSNISGFLVVTAVNVDRGTITVISPAPRPLPYKYLLYGELQHLEMS